MRSSIIPFLLGTLLLAACGPDDPDRKAPAARAPGGGGRPAPAKAVIRDGPHDIAVLHIRGMGDIRFELLPEIAPKTVASFTQLARNGFFDGTQFHRVIPGFMIQGGDPNTQQQDPRQYGKGGPGYTIEDEFSDLPHTRGIVSMANSGIPDTGGSQFFILHADARHLDGRHAAFGRVVAGMDVVDAITKVEIDTYGRYGPKDRPYPEPVVVESVRIEPAAAAEGAPAMDGGAADDTEDEAEAGDGDGEAEEAAGS